MNARLFGQMIVVLLSRLSEIVSGFFRACVAAPRRGALWSAGLRPAASSARKAFSKAALAALAALGISGCVNIPPYDYTNYRAHPPRSILVLPPLNESMSVEGTYSYLSTVTRPIAELGYYVFPVAVIDQYLKENGMPTAGEMHQVPLSKVNEILGADAVMYITLEQYGSKYQVLNSATMVSVRARMVDTKTGTLLWEGRGSAESNSGGSGDILGDLISAALTQALNSGTDAAHDLCDDANANLFYRKDHGLLYGPYSPEFGKEKK